MNGSNSTMKIVVVAGIVFVILYILFNTDITKKTRGDKTKIEIKTHLDVDANGCSDANSSVCADEDHAGLVDVDGVEVEATEQA